MATRSLPSPFLPTMTRSSSVDRLLSTSLPFSSPFPLNSSPLPLSRGFRFPLHLDRLPRSPVRFSACQCGRSVPVSADSSVVDEAREAVEGLLREFGASEEDSISIAMDSPKYVEMLVANVRELDEYRLWGSWSSGMGEEGKVDFYVLDFKKKVYYMAKSKGDKGMLPFLESIGLKFSSATLIATYLASETLPELIDKVRFMREMLFSSSGNEVLIGRNAKRMMVQLSIPADEDIQSTLSFFEKMEARHGGLRMLGHGDASFPYLIESFPKLLLCSKENHLKPLVSFLELVGVPVAKISAILLSFPPLFFYNVEKDIKPRMHALGKVGVQDKDIARMLLKYPWILSTSIQENYAEIVAFFKGEKISKSNVDIAIKSWPHMLGCSTRKMKSFLEQLNGLDVTKKMLVPVITSSPQLLLRKPNEFLEVVSFMEEMGFDRITIGRILCRCPEIFAANVDSTLRKKVEFLTDFGISRGHLPRIIRKYPELLLLDIHNTLLPRMEYLVGVGLSKREVCSMIYRFSPLLGYSIEVVLKPKIQFLLSNMGKPLKEIVEYPRYFSYSLDKKIKPRFWVLKNRNIECGLKDMLAKNDDGFAEEYMGMGKLLVVSTPIKHKDGS
ncbi:uncharacterized protein [Typha angustifolia]|uniref:uncharacterized protein n=1 Tax=Typha angustifolia TaxID=59011 RepID=UPI003C30A56C